jgi:hypothetical protein
MKLICFPLFKLIILDKATLFENFKDIFTTDEAYDIFATVVCDAVGWFFYWCLKRTRSTCYRARRYDGSYWVVYVPSRTAVYEILSTPVGVTECPRKGAAMALNGNLEIF